jgi:hypothetical protein
MHHMTYYRAYIIGQDGHFKEAINLDCVDDTTAVESAKQLVNGHDVELWQHDRMVAKLPSTDE